MDVPTVETLGALSPDEALDVTVAAVEHHADVSAVLGDLVHVPEAPDAVLPGSVWLVCRLADGAVDSVSPPRTREAGEVLLTEQESMPVVVGWTRPLTAVAMHRGYLVRVELNEDTFMPLAQADLGLLDRACARVAMSRYPEFDQVVDATAGWRERCAELAELNDGGPTTTYDPPNALEGTEPGIESGGLLGDGWGDLEDPTAAEDPEMVITLADHYALQPVPPDVRERRRAEDVRAEVEVMRGRYEIVDTRSGEVVTVWRLLL